ncbi:MAG: ABC transporter substrate-binding protein, partial [Gemmiger sp.]|nr:ABC transporter substrate-binding protein [Gemmiger sp.]
MKKAIALTLAAAMAAGLLAGCGGGSASSAASSAASSTAGSSEAAASGKPTITFMMPTFYGTEFQNEGVDQVIEKYESYTGVHVEWRLEANDTYKDKFGLTLMDKDNMPMVLTASGALDANIVDAAKKGAFWDLGPFLADTEAYPNLSQANENVLKGLTVDGQI